MDSQYLPDKTTEENRYKAHQNGPHDEGYVKFLRQAITPALPFLSGGMQGLDYGCGPTPTLGELLATHGLHCENYDPFFYPALPERHYDYIFATEVFEHFFNPASDLERICKLLVPGAILTIMTELWDSLDRFADWHYARDITHVSFYHATTIEYMCATYGFKRLNQDVPRVFVLKKTP